MDRPGHKQVLALQAFVPRRQADRLRDLGMAAVPVSGARVAFEWGAEPHVTLSAWRVTPCERERALDRFRAADWSRIGPLNVRCELSSLRSDETLACYLVPSAGDRGPIDEFRRRALAVFNLAFEDFGGRTREDWWPHLTLFSVPVAQEDNVKAILAEAEKTAEFTLDALALVGFEDGIETLEKQTLGGKGSKGR
jgi:hypothetical protein